MTSLVEYRKRVYPVVQLVLQKKDIFRLKEEMELSGNLPNVFQTIWHHITFDHVEFKALEEKLSIQGEMKAFFLYEGEGDNDRRCGMRIQCLSAELLSVTDAGKI